MSTQNFLGGSCLETFNQLEHQIEGFIQRESIALWDSFLAFQKAESINGSMFELGVYKGRSALLSSLHLRETEKFFLIDGTPFIHEAQQHLEPILKGRGVYVEKMSYAILPSEFEKSKGQCRWVHIDGEHTGRAIINDLELCEPLLADDGVLILDDFFNPMYPQLTEAAFHWLSINKYKLSIFLCGWNKAYLTRPLRAYYYRNFIVNHLANELHAREIDNFIITKTSTLDESTAFGICHRFTDRDYYGLDSNPDFLPI